ncbi:putative fatty acyl-CoA reductase CG5065 [Zerene cesonia]|uniref:putative fatty acyl-CoA reductase CG5065 n=1 Tax=Zerene cesonia TaxID=33412 RepID=UPI0018E524C7|nr:putative fatty acyl-CoA reductase CG5065 [Zerene cesonia]
MASMDNIHDTSVPGFYAGKSVFITGGTGFLGKGLIEKLLYSCKDIGKVYILVREKKGVSGLDRIKKILDSEPFARLRETRPQDLEKIVPIYGDLVAENLGISQEDQEILFNEVSVVFHLAATIKFNEPLSVAMKVNVEGTKEVMKLAQQMKLLKSFVYVSTAYSNTSMTRWHIEEKLYPSPKPMNEVYDLIKNNDPSERFSPEVLDGRPNTYSFTKALAENFVVENHGDMPTVIVRPAIVTAAVKEPVAGWIDNWQGPTPVLALIAKGWVRTLYGDKKFAFDIIPVDYVINLTIVSGSRCKKSKEVPIYHACSSTSNPITLKKTSVLYTKEALKCGFNELPFPGMLFSKLEWFLALATFILQTVPAYLADFFLYLIGKPARYIKTQTKLASYLDTIRFFSSQSWMIMSDKTRAMFYNLSPEDRKTFPCDASLFSWEEYMPIYYHGVKRFLIDPAEKNKKSLSSS